MKKEEIKRELWERDFVRELQRRIVNQAVGAFEEEYVGKNVNRKDVTLEDITLEDIKKRNIVATYAVTVQMITSYMINSLLDKVVDEVISIVNGRWEDEKADAKFLIQKTESGWENREEKEV